ncbi:uncharacterized protein LOC129909614 [Episyrphus balteatus]|uniref:uncharacterized protein LOC129909614 n=1 Tax=Episyrphus balteatus TaxID=286459 RepID=UPI002486C106|nr:uncharacterized protein LOC129909614 [Episyrphus balteatus]
MTETCAKCNLDLDVDVVLCGGICVRVERSNGIEETEKEKLSKCESARSTNSTSNLAHTTVAIHGDDSAAIKNSAPSPPITLTSNVDAANPDQFNDIQNKPRPCLTPTRTSPSSSPSIYPTPPEPSSSANEVHNHIIQPSLHSPPPLISALPTPTRTSSLADSTKI